MLLLASTSKAVPAHPLDVLVAANDTNPQIGVAQRLDGLVASRGSHRDLRGHKRAAVVGPAERRRFADVVLDERMTRSARWSTESNSPRLSESSFQDREEQFDLVQSTRVCRGEMQVDMLIGGEELGHRRGLVGREVVDDAVEIQSIWGLVDEV